MPFHLAIVDCNTPEKYKKQMAAVLSGFKNVRWISYGDYLLPNQSRNRLIDETDDEYLCFIENDILVEDNWLSLLLSACQETAASVAVPHIMEGRTPLGPAHFDWRHHRLREIPHPSGTQIEILPRTSWEDYEPGKFKRRQEVFLEAHCMLFHRKVFEAFGHFDEEHNTREELDISLQLHSAGIPIWFEPESHVHFLSPDKNTLESEEKEFFKIKWDLDRAYRTHQLVQEKWNLVEVPNSIPFVKSRLALL
ncbi:MAG TPA: glycosyltransferase, partial [Acidobacteriota bacterium]|nr:glycosyltransferase [Acidobacteriota bacterium]